MNEDYLKILKTVFEKERGDKFDVNGLIINVNDDGTLGSATIPCKPHGHIINIPYVFNLLHKDEDLFTTKCEECCKIKCLSCHNDLSKHYSHMFATNQNPKNVKYECHKCDILYDFHNDANVINYSNLIYINKELSDNTAITYWADDNCMLIGIDGVASMEDYDGDKLFKYFFMSKEEFANDNINLLL